MLVAAFLVPPSLAQAELDAVWPPHPTESVLAGLTVAMSEFWLAVSDSNAITAAGNSPRVLMYRRTGNAWVFDSHVPTPGIFSSLAMDDGTLFVGSEYGSMSHPGGAVQVFEHFGGSWQFTQTLGGDDPMWADLFGRSVAATQDRIVVGAPADFSIAAGSARGAVYVFERSATGWELEARLESSSAAARSLGESVALSDDLVVSTSQTSGFGSLPAVEIFQRNGATWEWTQRIASPPSPGFFGKSIAIDGSGYIAVGDDRGGASHLERAGSVTVYERQGTQFAFLQELLHPNPVRFDEFGAAVAWVEGTLIVGTPHWDPAAIPLINGPGSLEMFRRLPGAPWFTHVGRATASLGSESDYVGWSLATSDGLVATGTPLRDAGAGHVGGASVFRFGEALGTVICDSNPNSTGGVGSLLALGSDTVAANQLRLVGFGLPPHAVALGLVSPQSGFSPFVAGSQGSLCLGGPIGRVLGSVQVSNDVGRFTLPLDLTALPTPLGSASVVAGDHWTFQAWYRDVNPQPTSNFTDAVRVRFSQ